MSYVNICKISIGWGPHYHKIPGLTRVVHLCQHRAQHSVNIHQIFCLRLDGRNLQQKKTKNSWDFMGVSSKKRSKKSSNIDFG